jgi:hypothetical protein
MRSFAILLALSLFAGCGVRALASGEYSSLQDCVTECVDAAWGDVKTLNRSGGYSVGGNSKARGTQWEYRLSLSKADMADRTAALRDLLLTKLEEAGAHIHGRGTTGEPDNLIGFSLNYTSAGEEGMVWARRVSHGDEDNSIFIVFHGVNTN